MAVLRSLMLAMAAMPMAHAALAEPPHHPMHVDQPPLQVELGETVEKVAVTVEYLGGHTRSGDMTVTHYQPTGAGPFPAIVIQHGRASNRRTLPWRWRMIMQARFWTRRGFAVFVPTRLGYGETGLHPDPEIAGRCDAPELKPMIRVLTDQNTAAIEFARRKPWVDPDRVLLLGQSLGGLASLATGAVRLPGVAGIINFAGGFGGRPDRLRNPCAPERLAAILGEIGTAATVPSLWIYAENDQLWGADWPRDWHRAYVGNGADPQRTSSAEFHMLPAIGVEGHDFQVKGFGLWRPLVDRFIARLGFQPPATPAPPQPTAFARLSQTDRVPLVGERGRLGYQRFLEVDLPRAFVIGPKGNWAMASGAGALDRAMETCQRAAKSACRAYAVDDAVVWTPFE